MFTHITHTTHNNSKLDNGSSSEIVYCMSDCLRYVCTKLRFIISFYRHHWNKNTNINTKYVFTIFLKSVNNQVESIEKIRNNERKKTIPAQKSKQKQLHTYFITYTFNDRNMYNKIVIIYHYGLQVGISHSIYNNIRKKIDEIIHGCFFPLLIFFSDLINVKHLSVECWTIEIIIELNT